MCAESPFTLVYACVVYAWVGGCLHGVANKRGEKKRRHLLSRLSAREVAGKLSGPANDIPFLQQLDAVLQLLKLFSHIPTSRKTSTGASYTPRSQPQDLFFTRVSPSSPSSSLFPFLALSLLRSPSFGPQVAPPTQISRGQSYLPVTDCDEVWEMYTWKGPVCYVGLYHMAWELMWPPAMQEVAVLCRLYYLWDDPRGRQLDQRGVPRVFTTGRTYVVRPPDGADCFLRRQTPGRIAYVAAN